MAHVQSNQLQPHQFPSHQWQEAPGVLAPLAADGRRLGTSGALAPARGALLGSVLGLACWAVVGSLAWMVL